MTKPNHINVGTPTVTVMSYAADEELVYYGQRLVARFRQTDTWVRKGKAWHMLASQATALPTPIEGRVSPRRVLDAYAGEFALTPDITLTITVADSGLHLVRASRPAERPYAIDERIFVRHAVRGWWRGSYKRILFTCSACHCPRRSEAHAKPCAAAFIDKTWARPRP